MRDGERESVRNALLRRADWRFLVADATPETTVCFNGGPLRDAAAYISGTLLEPAAAGPQSCSLAVAVNPSREIVDSAFRSLRPGGSCYVEYHGRSATPWSARRSLALAGFTDVRAYWPWPSLSDCRAWIPLAAPPATSAFFGREQPAGSGWRGRLAAIPTTTLAARRWLAGTFTFAVVGRKPGTTGESRHDFLRMLRDRWDDFRLGPRPRHLYPVLQVGGKRSINKVIALVFRDDDARPVAAVKIARVPESAPALVREAETLDALHAGARGVEGIPRVLFCQRDAHVVWVAETSVSGVPISKRLTTDTYAHLAALGTQWLTRLAHASRLPGNGWEQVRDEALTAFEANYRSAVGADLLDAIRRRLAAPASLPTICEHRDFSPWNVLIDERDALSVVDWESSVLRGVPALDVIYFLSWLHAYLHHEPLSRRSYRAAWDRSTRAGAANIDCAAEYCREVGIDRSHLPSLRLLTWLVHTRSQHFRLTADSGGAPTADALRQGWVFQLVEEEAAGAMPELR